MTSPLELLLRSALLGTGLLQPVDSGTVKGKTSTVWVLSRQVPGQERAWLGVADELLTYGEDSGTDVHLCRKYLRKNGRMVFGWYLALSAAPRRLAQALGGVQQILAAAVPELTDALADAAAGSLARGDDAAFAAPPPGSLRPPEREQERWDDVRPQEPTSSTPPPGFVPRIRVVRDEIDGETGRRIVEEEVPLPHVYRELNQLNERGRGAKFWTGRFPGGRSS